MIHWGYCSVAEFEVAFQMVAADSRWNNQVFFSFSSLASWAVSLSAAAKNPGQEAMELCPVSPMKQSFRFKARLCLECRQPDHVHPDCPLWGQKGRGPSVALTITSLVSNPCHP